MWAAWWSRSVIPELILVSLVCVVDLILVFVLPLTSNYSTSTRTGTTSYMESSYTCTLPFHPNQGPTIKVHQKLRVLLSRLQ